MPCFSMSAMRSASVRSNGGLVSPSTISTVVGWKRDPFWYSGITWREGESLWNCLLDHPLKTHVTLTANWCSHIAALCSGGDPVSGCSGLASEDLPETPQCSNCSSSWWVSPPCGSSSDWSLLWCQKEKNLSKAGKTKWHRSSAETVLSETATGLRIVKEHSVDGPESGREAFPLVQTIYSFKLRYFSLSSLCRSRMLPCHSTSHKDKLPDNFGPGS